MSFKARFFSTAILPALLALAGCSHATLKERACGGTLARFDERMQALALGLSPWTPARSPKVAGNRVPASEQPAATYTVSGELLEWRDRESWMKLSRDILNEVQDYLDIAVDNAAMAPVRRKVARLADQVVALHGYALSGRSDRMQDTLAEARIANADLRAELCGDRDGAGN